MRKTGRPDAGEQPPDGLIGPLLKLAGRRPMPDPAQMARARTAAREEWARVVRRRGWRVSLWRVSVAALVAVASGAALWMARQPRPPLRLTPAHEVATVAIVTGRVVVTDAQSGEQVPARAGMRLRAGDRLDTGAGGKAALSRGGHDSIRLDRGTLVEVAADRLRLGRGAVYVDAGTGDHDPALRVETKLGVVDHLGTQFEARLLDDTLRVSVREGSVRVTNGATQSTSHAGERLIVGAHRPVERETVEPFASDWQWTVDLASSFELEGAAVPEFLDWAARELGMPWEYDDPDMRDWARRIVLHGSLAGLTPDEALTAVLPTCGMTFRQEPGRILVLARKK